MNARAPVKLWMWGAWAAAAFAVFAAAFLLNLTYVYGAQLIDPAGSPGLALMRLVVSPVLTVAGLVLSVVALVLLLFRRFSRVLLAGQVGVALLLFAHAGVEAYRLAQAS